MLTGVAAAVLALAIVTIVLSCVSLVSTRRRLGEAVAAIDATLAGASDSLRRALDAVGTERRGPTHGLVLDLDQLLGQIAREAAGRTGAHAAAVRVRGDAHEPAVAAFGSADAAALLETTVRPVGGAPPHAVTLDLSLLPTLDAEAEPYRSAVVVPVVEEGVNTGAVGVFSHEPSAFRPDHADALEALVAETAEAISTARRFAAVGGRIAAAVESRTGTREHDLAGPAGAPEPARTPGDVPA